jgi:hypothetical protein
MLHRRLVAMASAAVCFVGYALVAQAQPDLMQFGEHSESRQVRRSDRPEVNPSPQRILVIEVHKDPRIELWLDSDYGTMREECRTQTAFARLLGAPDVTQVVTDSVRLPAGQRDFTVRFFLDRYLPGRCNWQPMGIGHSEFLPEESSHPDVNSGIVLVRPKSTPLSMQPEVVSEMDLAWVCHREEPHTHTKGLFCWPQTRTSSHEHPYGQAISIDGGHMNIEFTLAPD